MRKKNMIYFGVVFALVVTVGMIVLFFIDRARNNVMENENLKSENLKSEDQNIGNAESVENKEYLFAEGNELRDELEKEPEEELAGQKENKIEKEEVVLTFGGDICFYDEFALMVSYRQRNEDITKCISQELLERVRNADVFMLNNEFTYTERGEPLEDKAYTFRSKKSNVKILYELGVDIVGLANNHAYDYGEISLLDTLDTLKEAEMKCIGAGRNIDEASEPAIFDFGEFKVGYINVNQIERFEEPQTKGATKDLPGVFRCYSEEEFSRLLTVVDETKRKVDFLVVYIHWGTENTDELDWAQTYQAPLIARAGADAIIGNHPHCLQGIEYIGNVPVVYSLGNFWFNSKELYNGIVELTVNKEGLKSMQFLPGKQENCASRLLYGEEKTNVLEYIRSISKNVVIDSEGYCSFGRNEE